LQSWCAEIAGGKLQETLRSIRKEEDNIVQAAKANVGAVRDTA
jgi:deoxycytidylate deaminase